MEGSSGQACAIIPNQSDQGPAHWNEVMRPSWQELLGLVTYAFRVRQGCVLAPALFRIVIDWIIDYAGDAVLFAEDDDAQWTSIFESFNTAANAMGLHTSWAKTKIQNVASGPSPYPCIVSGHQVEAVNGFTYLGSILTHRATVHQKFSGGAA